MYKVVFVYADGRKGECIENGAPLQFENETAAASFADDLNNKIPTELKLFFPVWKAEKA